MIPSKVLASSVSQLIVAFVLFAQQSDTSNYSGRLLRGPEVSVSTHGVYTGCGKEFVN